MKPIIHFTTATVIRYVVLMIAISLHVTVFAQTATSDSTSADEQTIRNLVARANSGDTAAIKFTDAVSLFPVLFRSR